MTKNTLLLLVCFTVIVLASFTNEEETIYCFGSHLFRVEDDLDIVSNEDNYDFWINDSSSPMVNSVGQSLEEIWNVLHGTPQDPDGYFPDITFIYSPHNFYNLGVELDYPGGLMSNFGGLGEVIDDGFTSFNMRSGNDEIASVMWSTDGTKITEFDIFYNATQDPGDPSIKKIGLGPDNIFEPIDPSLISNNDATWAHAATVFGHEFWHGYGFQHNRCMSSLMFHDHFRAVEQEDLHFPSTDDADGWKCFYDDDSYCQDTQCCCEKNSGNITYPGFLDPNPYGSTPSSKEMTLSQKLINNKNDILLEWGTLNKSKKPNWVGVSGFNIYKIKENGSFESVSHFVEISEFQNSYELKYKNVKSSDIFILEIVFTNGDLNSVQFI